jgi:hypothetical protein
MKKAKRISKIKYFTSWTKEGFPKRLPKTKAFIITKKRR